MSLPITHHASPITEFAHIRRMRDQRFPQEIAVIMPGEYFVSREPMIVSTVLGSCVSVCIRDPLAGVGGMNHFMLPAPKGDGRSDSWGESARYGSFAMELLINEILKRGGHRSRMEVKVFGGGKIYDGSVDIGSNNAAWAMHYLAEESLPVAKLDVGGVCPRRVYYFTQDGRVLLKKLGRLDDSALRDREEQYLEALRREKVESNVTLF